MVMRIAIIIFAAMAFMAADTAAGGAEYPSAGPL
jgi:hypothetical protein